MQTNNQQFLYKLELQAYLNDENNWTERENDIVSRHFSYLVNLKEEGKLILAGRTSPTDGSPFGIVIFKEASEEAARNVMNNDPAVKEGIMTAELYPYRVAIISEQNS